ncbi:iron-containing alcohol dehydrogenase [Dehalococcoidia bacterium]|nr:iron-containing alcohol dehydrogenase [Dehalococcoidia bacterium]
MRIHLPPGEKHFPTGTKDGIIGENWQGKSAFIVTDANIVKLGLVDLVKGLLSQAGIESTIFDGVEPDPSIETVRKGAVLMSEYGPDWVVAVGGRIGDGRCQGNAGGI